MATRRSFLQSAAGVAMRGPLVLFAITNDSPRVTRQQLLAAAAVPGEAGWQADAASGPLHLLPFTAIRDERYATYLTLS